MGIFLFRIHLQAPEGNQHGKINPVLGIVLVQSGGRTRYLQAKFLWLYDFKFTSLPLINRFINKSSLRQLILKYRTQDYCIGVAVLSSAFIFYSNYAFTNTFILHFYSQNFYQNQQSCSWKKKLYVSLFSRQTYEKRDHMLTFHLFDPLTPYYSFIVSSNIFLVCIWKLTKIPNKLWCIMGLLLPCLYEHTPWR